MQASHMLALKGTRQNRSILHAKADMKSQLFAKNAKMSRMFRRFPGSRLRPKKTTPEKALPAGFPRRCAER